MEEMVDGLFVASRCLNKVDEPYIALGPQGYNCRSGMVASPSMTLGEWVVKSLNNENVLAMR